MVVLKRETIEKRLIKINKNDPKILIKLIN